LYRFRTFSNHSYHTYEDF